MKLLKEMQESKLGSYPFIHSKDLFGPGTNKAFPGNQHIIVIETLKLKI